MKIKKVESKAELEAFVDFRTDLYKDSPIDVPFLFSDEIKTLTKGKNPSLDFCESEYYLAYDDNGTIVGRVAAIINPRANEIWNHKDVRFGWFDFIDDPDVSKALIDKVKEYGRKHGMENIVGPMGFTDLEREGMHVEGFEHMATIHANHNFPYYPQHMARMPEFKKDNDWVQLCVKIEDKVPEKFTKLAQMIEKRYNLHARKPTRHEMLKQGVGLRLFELLNECYAGLYGFSHLDDKQVNDILTSYMQLADVNLISIITDENENGKIVGFGVCFPSFSEAMRKTNRGRLLPFGWFHLLRTLKFHNTKTVDMLLVAVLPEYRSKGANALIFNDMNKIFIDYGFKEALTLAMMETNDKVLSQWQYYETYEAMRLRSYRAKL